MKKGIDNKFECIICRFKTSCKSNLSKHEKTKKHINNEIEYYENRKIRCNDCPFAAVDYITMKKHLKKHGIDVEIDEIINWQKNRGEKENDNENGNEKEIDTETEMENEIEIENEIEDDDNGVDKEII